MKIPKFFEMFDTGNKDKVSKKFEVILTKRIILNLGPIKSLLKLDSVIEYFEIRHF